MDQTQPKDKTKQLNAKLKQTWGRLNDSDIALYAAGKHDPFFDRL